MSIVVTPILPRFGAEISGVDITRPLDEETRRAIIDAQNRWGVTVWRGTGLDDASHVAFTRIFGQVEIAPRHGGRQRFSEPELFSAGNLTDDNQSIRTDESFRLMSAGNRLWHSDSSYMPVRSTQAALLCHEAPPAGGETWFADTRSAYDDLPQAMKDRIEGLEATHSYFWSRRQAGYPYTEEEIDSLPAARHRLVMDHAPTGRKVLFVGAHTRDIVGMDRAEGRALIRDLIEWATQPQYVFSVRYNPGDMTIWDNSCSLHRGGDFDDMAHRRDMRRTTVREPGKGEMDPDIFTRMFASAEVIHQRHREEGRVGV